MFVEDVESSDDVVFDDINEHVVMAHVIVIVLHVIAVTMGFRPRSKRYAA